MTPGRLALIIVLAFLALSLVAWLLGAFLETSVSG
jgi:hypothetical protein